MQKSIKIINEALSPIYPAEEVVSISNRLFEDLLGIKPVDMVMRKHEVLPESEAQKLKQALARLIKNEPLQYVLGYTEFYGLEFKVDESVLIPRPETEELVDWVKQSLGPTFSGAILDVGTGSGCIPIALSHSFPQCKVAGLDISKDALSVAKQNNTLNNTNVSFFYCDVLSEPFPISAMDVLVSNPPYICKKEMKLMHNNVLDYEPHLALFVEDDDPLLFYSVIAQQGKNALSFGGMLFFEINEAYGKETVDLLIDLGYRDVELKKDIFGKDRMVKGIK